MYWIVFIVLSFCNLCNNYISLTMAANYFVSYRLYCTLIGCHFLGTMLFPDLNPPAAGTQQKFNVIEQAAVTCHSNLIINITLRVFGRYVTKMQ